MTLRGTGADPLRHADVNAVVGGYLRDLAMVQTTAAKMFGYKRAASSIFRLDTALTELRDAAGNLPKIAGIGPGSTRVIQEILATGHSSTVEAAIDASGQRVDIERRRALRRHFLSRAEVLRILGDPGFSGPTLQDYQGDLQMHSEWSDGSASLEAISRACQDRGYTYSAVTDHSYGLKIAGGMSMQEAAEQRRALDAINAQIGNGFRLLQGVEANLSNTLLRAYSGMPGPLSLMAIQHGRIWITRWQPEPSPKAVSSRSIATPIPSASSPTPKQPSPMPGWRAFRVTAL